MTAQGDELRSKASALRASAPALASLRDWFLYWKQPVLTDAYAIVYKRVDQDAALLDKLGAAVDAKATTPDTFADKFQG